MRITVPGATGATGGIGRAIVDELSNRDHDVTAASRGVGRMTWPEGVRPVTVELRDPAATTTACQHADVVVMAAQVPDTGWATERTPLFDTAVHATPASDAKLVVVDNLYAYGSPGTPITETTPETATTNKGQLRARLGRRMLAAHEQGRCRVTIGRFSDHDGPDAVDPGAAQRSGTRGP